MGALDKGNVQYIMQGGEGWYKSLDEGGLCGVVLNSTQDSLHFQGSFVQGSFHLQCAGCYRILEESSVQDRMHLQGLVCKVVWVLTLVQGTTDLQGKVCRVVWRVVCTCSMHSMHSMHSVQGSMWITGGW